MSSDPYLSASARLASLARGDVSVSELVEACIARIEAEDGAFNAVVAKDYDRARERARQADAERREGRALGALHGLPITVKDSLETAGIVTTSGAPELRDYVPAQDAVVVQRMIDAGAIVLGKTNAPRYAGDWQSFNDVYGITNNPWDITRTVGGSSGGPAASLAAGFVPLEIGSDIAGSIRIPASYCGVYGHKPTHGIIPTRGHIPGPPGTMSEPDLAVVGPMALSATDLALALEVMAGPDVLESAGWALTLSPSRAQSLAEFRVGYWFEDSLCPIDSAVRTELEATVDALRPHVQVVDLDVPFHLDDIVPIYAQLLLGVIGTAMPKPLQLLARSLEPYYALAEGLGLSNNPFTKNAARGLRLSHANWNRVHEARTRLRWQCRTLFDDIDVLLMPNAPVVAPHHQISGTQLSRRLEVDGEKRPYTDQVPWITLATTAFLPATSAPIGVTPEGLPVNVQIVGPYLGDATTLRFAELLAEVHGGFRPPHTLTA